MTDTIKVDGTDLQTAARVLQVWEGVHQTPALRGSLIEFPTKDGSTDADQPFGSSVLGIGLMVQGGSSEVTGFNDQYRTLKRLCKPGRTVTLTKELSYTTGNESYTQTAKLRSLSPQQQSPADYKVLVEFTLLDGLWFGSAVTIGAGTSTVTGDVRTRRMTVTISGGSSPKTVTNSTNGWALTYTGSTATAVVIDVENMTATQGASDVSGNLSWTRDFPMQLEAGSNTLAISSGTLSIAYQPAFL
jgi:hypothetical protein